MDRFESMQAFVAVVESGGFSAASRKLGMPLATVSRKVSELEDKLGAQLLVRSTRSLALTGTGEDYFATCKRLLDELAEAERQVTGEYRAPMGSLVVSAPLTFGPLFLTPLIVDFLRAYPDVDIELRLSQTVPNMLDDQIDVAFRIGDLADSAAKAIRIGAVRNVITASPAYIAEHGSPRTPGELVDHDCVCLAVSHPPDQWLLAGGTGADHHPVRGRLVVTTADAAIEAAVAGLGITQLLCFQVAKAIDEGRLKLLLRDHEPAPLPIHLVYPARRLVPLKLRAFIDFATPRLKTSLIFDPK